MRCCCSGPFENKSESNRPNVNQLRKEQESKNVVGKKNIKIDSFMGSVLVKRKNTVTFIDL